MIRMTIRNAVVEVPSVAEAAALIEKLGGRPRQVTVKVHGKHTLSEEGRRSKARRLRRHWKKAREYAAQHGCSVREASHAVMAGK